MKKLVLLFALFCFLPIVKGQLKEHGIVSAVSENRGVLAHQTATGDQMIITIASDVYQERRRSSLLIIDAKTGQSHQYWQPETDDETSMDNYAYIVASNGRFFYTMLGDVFLEFDLIKREWSFTQKIDGRAMSFAEGPDGKIFFANYPSSRLYSFDPKERVLRFLGQLDDVQQYPSSLQVGNDGWVYAGIGTAKSTVIAFHIKTGTCKNLSEDLDTKNGDGDVFRGEDNLIYATPMRKQKQPLFRLENGMKMAVQLSENGYPKRKENSINFRKRWITTFSGGGRIKSFHMREKWAEIEDRRGAVNRISFEYESNGAGITSFTLGPDGMLWGSTAHPLRLWRYDPAEEVMTDWKEIKEISGGNFPNLVTVNNNVYGALYNGGMIWRFDSSERWDCPTNPLYMGEFKEIARPRAACMTSDHKNVVFGGFPGYGMVGGDLVFVNVADNKASVVVVQDQIPGLSTIALKSLPQGLLVGGTSTSAPGGGKPITDKAVLYLMDESTRKIIFQIVPVSSGADIMSLEVRDGLVYGITKDSQLFIFDPQTRKVLSQRDISAYGSPTRPGQTLILANNGEIYGVMTNTVFKITKDSDIVKLIDLPVRASAGIALHKDILYFGCGSKLWSYTIK